MTMTVFWIHNHSQSTYYNYQHSGLDKWIFAALFIVKMIAKFVGVYFFARKFIPGGSMYTTLLMSTGLTFGTISSLYGLNTGIISQLQYSILVGVVVASTVIPTFIAQQWFVPSHSEDIIEWRDEDE